MDWECLEINIGFVNCDPLRLHDHDMNNAVGASQGTMTNLQMGTLLHVFFKAILK
jgi:hypothetical protein